MKFLFSEPKMPSGGTVVVGVHHKLELTSSAQEVDKKTKGLLKRVLDESSLKGKIGDSLSFPVDGANGFDRIVVIGLGKKEDLHSLQAEEVGGAITARMLQHKDSEVAVMIDDGASKSLSVHQVAAHVAQGMLLRSYRFDKYMTKEKKEDKPALQKVTIFAKGAADAEKSFEKLKKISDGVFYGRDFISEPPNVLYPESMAKRLKELESLGVKVEVLDEAALTKMGMGALLGVGMGSERKPCLVSMQWNGASDKDQPVAFVGKGVTFDSGGINIKPSPGMEDMKWDMGGAAVVAGVMKAVAGRKAKANVVGVVALAENMPSGLAQRPSDVVKTMSGQTIEVLNTDAEGRLILADALWYTQDRFKPQFMVDLATLTMAVILALGHEYAGLFSNDDKLSKQLINAGKHVGEKLWRFPQGEVYDAMLKSDIADMQNVGAGRAAGSVTAAQFLQRFVNKTPWAHLDIAGMAWSTKDRALFGKGATAYGVRMLDHLVAENYESK
ncbi:MAG: leucyl aminopeptidase [Alphaproteobacteria bacterium]|nr:leucyl aminopeptidase [Alphaproteobacteria bacterium]MBT5389564.1 leucyl aminopeptidase [Alphaproteobacteria bacterium]MBT5541161.1 leucyl aminopeptidase [Alphaproteobacteria bacterium]MBT5654029.1 leucyl aminopeptidase [Alphaproteobacteria bacterium]